MATRTAPTAPMRKPARPHVSFSLPRAFPFSVGSHLPGLSGLSVSGPCQIPGLSYTVVQKPTASSLLGSDPLPPAGTVLQPHKRHELLQVPAQMRLFKPDAVVSDCVAAWRAGLQGGFPPALRVKEGLFLLPSSLRAAEFRAGAGRLLQTSCFSSPLQSGERMA